ncbi:MmgE/PrpD family protein [Methylobacterium sp. WSM2598]|uniref:MmgE/PrpD family protein n=1 Tax=Methylobacterium sp. WSM2598 TaxID=398261 RepID=UPI000366E5E8|nr:MmgE/PrpD family protein [Methylobacterium sp. WSM2598]
MPTLLERAASFLASLDPASLDGAARAAACEALTDCVGVALAGSQEPVARNLRSWARARAAGRSATVLGTRLRLDPENAALCNAVAGHALDFDDTSWTTIGHPSVVVAPVALAVGEEIGASGLAAVGAYLAGVEVAHRLAETVMPEVSRNGWHTTAALYAVGAAAAACALRRPGEAATIHALAIALTRSGGLRANFGTQAKPLHAGLAARSGLEAVSLAMAGVTASAEAFEGADGFAACFAGPAARARIDPGAVRFGEPFDLVARGLAYKRYPCCSGAHPALDLILDLRRAHGIAAEHVREIRVGTSLLAERELVCHAPRTPAEARFSLEFALAAALVRGRVALDTFDDATLADPALRRVMERVRMTVSPSLARLGFIGTAPVEMEIEVEGGRVISGSRDLAVGNPERPLSEADRRAKFLACAGRALAPSAAESAYLALRDLADLPSLEPLFDTLAGSPSPPAPVT